ncbi:uncharacterized protein TRIADDRAFT_57507 [Trichoplax adhaerens]|uniref:G-protein coupled receptors family 2 profile 2 domain-containing protein n=1 Tax=Trichoplax adhaerens TaxID=10228 RepID=B3RZM3_TRIAD|nr:predicted protein [Trichoplax adhaerens]EDV23863.1 predicted protein [Trichoplax adhaerens]|eukprot:XP_002113389.1 predicted protein [Trichoplax adhaerens]
MAANKHFNLLFFCITILLISDSLSTNKIRVSISEDPDFVPDRSQLGKRTVVTEMIQKRSSRRSCRSIDTILSCSNDDQDTKAFPGLCHCDSECILYGDCCMNYKNPCPETNVSLVTTTNRSCKKVQMTNWIKQRLPARQNKTLVSLYNYRCLKGSLVVTKCPSHWSDSYYRNKCENISDTFNFYSHVPVVHNTTNIAYRNIYCALCHRVNVTNLQDIRFWSIAIKCNLSENAIEFWSLQSDGLWKYCSLISLINYNDTTSAPRRKCRLEMGNEMISTCLSDPKSLKMNQSFFQAIRDGCQSYIAPIVSGGQLYHNPFCLMCSTTAIHLNVSCLIRSPLPPQMGTLAFGEGFITDLANPVYYDLHYNPLTSTITYRKFRGNMKDSFTLTILLFCEVGMLYNPWTNQCQNVFPKPIAILLHQENKTDPYKNSTNNNSSNFENTMQNRTCHLTYGNANTTAYFNATHVVFLPTNKTFLAARLPNHNNHFSFYNCTTNSSSALVNQTLSTVVLSSALYYSPAVMSIVAFMLQIYFHFHKRLICRWCIACWSLTVMLLEISIIINQSIQSTPSAISSIDCDILLAVHHFLELSTCLWTVAISKDVYYRSRHDDFLHHSSFPCNIFCFSLMAWLLPGAAVGCFITINKYSLGLTYGNHTHCHLQDATILVWYSCVPYCILASVCLLIYIAALLSRVQHHRQSNKNDRRLNDDSTCGYTTDQDQFSEYQKILFLMLMSTVVNSNLIVRSIATMATTTLSYMQYISISVHFLQGLIVGCVSFVV